MDKVAEASVVVERKVEESAEESEPKTVSPGTRKRPAVGGVEADETRDTNAGEEKTEKKNKPLERAILSEINKFDEACNERKKAWDRALGESRKLFTLMRDTNDWIEQKWGPDLEEFDRVYKMDRSKGEGKRRWDDLWRRAWIRVERRNDLKALTNEALEIVCHCECVEDLLTRMEGLTERLKELRERN